MAVGPGTILARWLNSLGVRYEEDNNCNCYRTMVLMNKTGPEAILADLDYWTNIVYESSQKWFKYHRNTEGILVRLAVKMFDKTAIRMAVERACKTCLPASPEQE